MQTPINGFSEAGAMKLREMSENSDVYREFLKFQGRVFKQSVNVALEFFAQKPESRFIATAQQWERSGFTIAQGSKAICFADHSGQASDYYDFSQMEEEVPPYLWTIHAGNAGIVKEALGIPKEKPLITGIINQTLTTSHITACMAALQVPVAEFSEFSRAYLNAVQVVIAGRLEVGGSAFKLPADTSVLKMLETDEQKLAFLTYAAKAAKDALKIIENVVQNEDIKERMKRNDIRSMAETDRGRTESSAGRGTAEYSAGTAEEQADSSTHEETGRRTGLGDNSESTKRQQHEMVSPVHDGDGERSGVLVQVQSAQRDLHAESDRDGTFNGGGADRELRHEVDPLHGGTVSPSGDDHEVQAQVSDGSTVGGQEGVGLSGTAGRTVREDESQTGGVQRDTGVGADQSILHGQHSDEGESLGAGDGALTAKVNSVFVAAETEEASSESDDAFDYAETAELPDEERLKLLTAEISRKTRQFTAYVSAGEYEKTPEIMQEINELTQIAAELKETIRTKPLTADDIQALRSIQPSKLSVSNFREEDVASTPKFEDTFNRTLGEKSPYQRTGYSPRSRDEQEVPIIDVQSRKCSFSSVKKDISSEVIAHGRSAEGGLVVTNADTGWTIQISRKGLEDSIAHTKSRKGNFTYPALYHVEDLVKNAVLLDTTVSAYNNHSKSKDTLFMHKLYAPIRVGSEFAIVKLTIEEFGSEHVAAKKRLYNLQDIKIKPLANLSLTEKQLHLSVPNGSVISIADLTAFVKSYDEDFFENPTAIGRDAREAELYTQAEYQDALIAFETGEAVIPTETDAQLERFADARSMTTEEAAPIMQDLIAEYIETIEEEQAAADADFEEKVHTAFSEVVQNHSLNESQRRCLKNLEKFAIEHQVHTDLAAEALNPESGSSFAARYGGRSSLSRIFNKRWSAIEKELNAALAKQFAPAEEKVDTYSNFEKLEPAHLTSEVFISYAASVIQDDRTVRNSHENSDKENFVLDVHAAIDQITTELMTMERTIEDYPLTEVAVYINSLSKDADLHNQIYDEITESVDTGLTILEEARRAASEADLSFSDKFSSGADDESDPFIYDGSMSPEDALKVQEQFERELITESPVIDLPEHWFHVDLAEVRSVTFDITDVATRGAEEELYHTTREFSYDPESKHIMMAEVSNDLFDTGHETPVKHEEAIAEIKGILAQYHDNLDVTIRHMDGSVEQLVPLQPVEEKPDNIHDTAAPSEATEKASTYSTNSDPEVQPAPAPAPTVKKHLTQSEKLYKEFTEMFPDLVSGTHTHERYGNVDDAYEPLSVEHLGGDQYSFMTYYIQEGDLMRDPDFTFTLDHEAKTLTIMEYQQDGVPPIGTIYQRVHDEHGNPDRKLLAALEQNFLQVLKNARYADRPLAAYTDSNGEVTKLETSAPEETETIEPVEISTDRTPELRAVLNAFSEKHGLGELNIEDNRYNWKLTETLQDGTVHQLGEINNPDPEMPFTPENLRTALETFEKEVEMRKQTVSDLYGRKALASTHGGVSALPKVQEDLPEITYAKNPADKVSDNLAALRELKRLERAERNGQPLYDRWNTQQDSENALRRYCGWGGLPQVFDENFGRYDLARRQLQSLLTPEEYAAARESTVNAHYTPQIIIDAMYTAIQNMDLPRDARILEPSCGTGNFISRKPHSLGDAEVVGVEIDNVTARIAKQLHRNDENVTIMECGFERSGLTDGSFDLAIGNVPFGSYKLNDPDYAQDWLIHDAFFRKALDKVAAGGVVAFVTSSGTMDKASPKVREYLATQAELVGAIRLPNTAFADAGTKVTSDIIFLKKREHPLQAHEPKPDWCYTIPNADGLKINSYFVQNPQMVLGKMEQTTHFDMLTCTPHEGADLKVQLNEAIKNLNAKISVTKREKAIQQQRGMIEPWGKNFSYQVQDGKVYYRETDTMQEVKGSKKDMQQLAMLCELRDVTRKLLDMQKTSATDEDLLPIREKLNEVYDAYKKEFGTVSEKKVKKLFGADSDFPIIQSLEKHSEETQQYEKADIFFRRTVNPMAEIKAVQTAEEALQVSLDQRGFPNIVYMATLLREQYPDAELPEIADKVCTELLDKGAIFIDPEKCMPDVPYSGVVERSEYLSGNVRMKHTMALEYAKADPLFERNAAALAEVIPEDIRAEEIAVQMGCPWIEPQDYTAFLQHLSGRSTYSRNSEVSYSPVTGEFTVMNAGSKKDLNLAETTTYGTADYSLYQLAEKILNQRRIAVMREKPHPKDPSKTITRTDPRATKLAMEKAKLIREEFKKWIFADPARKAKYERKYNDIFNSLVGREYDGSKLTFPGMSAGFVLRPHQKDCVARAIYGGNTLAAHVVGAGKSAVMFSTVMKKKELGLIHKACVVVPKALTEQVASEWRKLYPDAKLLTVTSDDLSSEAKRKLFTARVATGSYDAVIMSQEQFEKISMSKAYRVAFMQKELDKLEDMLRERKRESSGKRDFSVKNLETAKKRLKARIEKLTDQKAAAKAKDDLLEFEQLGFDYLVCDEAHAYKNGFVTTKMTNVAGVTTRPSGRAEDMQMKTDYFNEQFGQGHILFCTGTPVSNSMTELYVMTRYLRPDLLEQAGVARFDDWASTFGNVVTKNQQGADGTLKLRTSFASFANLPELMAMYKEFADVQSADKLQLPRPKLKTGKPQIVSVPATPEQKAYVQSLAERARAIAAGLVEPYEDNLLKITGEARLIGLGNAAIRSLYEKREEELPVDFVDGTDSKVDACIRNVTEIYQQTADTRGVQIIFSDIAVNADHGNFSVYDYLKEQLIAAGIPEEEIIFAPKSDAKNRADIFRDINDAKYRVVIASTGTLGTGANIQQNLCALHHIDVPWKPSDFEQREGRILRQGNRYDEVQIFNYVTEGTLDSYLYQTVTDKARFIAQLLDDKCPARVSEDCDEKVLTFGEIQAAAEGNPDFKRRIELANEIAELTMLRTEYTYETGQMQRKVESIPAQIEKKKETLAHIQSDKKSAEHISELVLRSQNGHTLIDRKAINAYLLDMAQKKAADPNENVPSVTINGFEVSVRAEDHLALGTEAFFTVKGEYTYTCSAGLTENQDNYQRLCNLFAKGIVKSEEDTVKAIADLETNLQQATERVGIPWQYETELETKTEELAELELRLAGLSVPDDDVCDAEEELIVETAEEVQKRQETFGNTDENDFQPVDDDMTPPTNGTRK